MYWARSSDFPHNIITTATTTTASTYPNTISSFYQQHQQQQPQQQQQHQHHHQQHQISPKERFFNNHPQQLPPVASQSPLSLSHFFNQKRDFPSPVDSQHFFGASNSHNSHSNGTNPGLANLPQLSPIVVTEGFGTGGGLGLLQSPISAAVNFGRSEYTQASDSKPRFDHPGSNKVAVDSYPIVYATDKFSPGNTNNHHEKGSNYLYNQEEPYNRDTHPRTLPVTAPPSESLNEYDQVYQNRRNPSSYFPTPVTTPTPPPSQLDTAEGNATWYRQNSATTSADRQPNDPIVSDQERYGSLNYSGRRLFSSGFSFNPPNEQFVSSTQRQLNSLPSPGSSSPDISHFSIPQRNNFLSAITDHLLNPPSASVAGSIISRLSSVSGPASSSASYATRRYSTGGRKRNSFPGLGYRRLSSIMAATEQSTEAASRPKRVRTGCLTCRQRHLKCDEAMPECQNCRKSSRVCKRGVRLNFIDTTVKNPPVIPVSHPWKVEFQDESREIASEYAGGYQRYAAFEVPAPKGKRVLASASPKRKPSSSSTGAPAPLLPEPLPPIEPHIPMAGAAMNHSLSKQSNGLSEDGQKGGNRVHGMHPPGPPSGAASVAGSENLSHSVATGSIGLLSNPEEAHFMQVYVEEVGCWMDSMNPEKHFSRLLPYHALGEPMLLNAFLACGARHLALMNPGHKEDKALHYYDTATRLLLDSLTNPNRNTAVCATTSVILNMYEIMSERALQRMNHIAGARALIKECGWTARDDGIGGACFWINVTMELLSCLHFNWNIAWDPDDWGVDMDFSNGCEPGREEIWAHRIIYLLAKIANFRASIPRYQESSTSEEHTYWNNKVAERFEEWKRLKERCEEWNASIPRNMHPMARLAEYQSTTKSAFPEVWIIKRVVIISRLFYHTAMVLLAQINPIMSNNLKEMNNMAAYHAREICGIVAPLKDRGVASVALRSLAIAAECLTDRIEQEEVLRIFARIKKETGWRVDFLFKELKETWGWQPDPSQQPEFVQAPPTSLLTTTLLNHVPATVAPPPGFAPNSAQFQPLHTPPSAIQAPKPRKYPMTNPLQQATSLDFTSQAPHPYYPHYVSAPQQPSERHVYF